MCGIAGYFHFNGDRSSELLKQMTDSLVHRGPDDSGYECLKVGSTEIGLGQRRLSILDLSPLGHQPMSFNDTVVVFNGEIYNFLEIRSELEQKGYQFQSGSDTEVILKGYDCWGVDVVHRFVGMFAIVLVDKAKQKAFFIRDRAGVKPLFIFRKENTLLFASELKAFFPHPRFEKRIDPSSLSLFLQFSYIPTPYTIFFDTVKLEPGHLLTYDLNTAEVEKKAYWDVIQQYDRPTIDISDQEAIAQTDLLMQKAYNYRMIADVPVGVFLSGGYDSSSVAALLQSSRTEKLKTFTIGFHESSFNEAPEAKKIANYLGTDHTEWYLTAKEAADVLPLLPEIYDEPFADNSTVPTVLVSKLARKQVKVALSADGGDEIFAGYHKFNQALKYTLGIPPLFQSFLSGAMAMVNPDSIPYFNKQYNFSTRYEKMALMWAKKDPHEAIKLISQYTTTSEVDSFLAQKVQRYPTNFDLGSNFQHKVEPLNRMLAIDYKTFLLDNNLVKVDRATMSVGLEGREPMLDHQLLEFLATLPAHLKSRDGVNKWLLKQVVHKYIPKELMERPKKPFIAPLMHWFKQDLQEQLRYYLSEEALLKSGLFHPTPIIALRDAYLAGEKRVNYQKLWQILVFQLWYNRWIQAL